MNQNRAPFWDALLAYHKGGIIPFHTPGHKLRAGAFANIEEVLGSGYFSLDPSDEVEAKYISHDFETVLGKAEDLAAQLFGAQKTMFLVNGTTGGLHYLLMPTTGSVLIPRFSHQAVYSAMMLSQGQVAYIPSTYDQEWLIPMQPQKAEIAKALENIKPQVLALTHPTYYGTTADLSSIVELAKKSGTLVFVDEAHGGHFIFSDRLPLTALECGVDGVVQSTHKTLGSFTQTSMLHINNVFWHSKTVQAQKVLQTTSPSLVFFAVLDEVRRVLAIQGANLVENSLELADKARGLLHKINGVELLPDHLQGDATKLVFSLRSLGLTGIEVERILRMDYNIQVELSDYYNVLALISIGDTAESVEKLVAAIRDLANRRGHLAGSPLRRHKLQIPKLPPIILSLREAFFSEKQEIPLKEAIGRVSGGFLTPYPPGVPIIAPGEQFTQDTVEYLLWCIRINWPIRGLMSGRKVVILEDNCSFCRKTR